MKNKIIVEPYQGVFHWFIKRGTELLAGGYCATERDARSDARSWLRIEGRFQRN